jgi:prepilin-type N-terminal cleavage/methylation domain-containing protein
MKKIVSIRIKGFTLIEVLVTVVIIGVLAAVVIPAVTSQVGAGDSSRVVSDLNNLRTGIENFDIAVRQFPGDVDDLVNQPGTEGTSTTSSTSIDADLVGGLYTGAANWKGPYIEATLPNAVVSGTDPNLSGEAFGTGYAAYIDNRLLPCASATADVCDSSATSARDYVTVQVENLTAAQADQLNTLFDGAETAASTTGRFRYAASGTTYNGYYYAAPFK